MLMMNRRIMMLLGLSGLMLPRSGKVHAENGLEAELAAFMEGAPSTAGHLDILIDDIAENGRSVPLQLSSDLPHTNASFIREIALFGSANPTPRIARFTFTPQTGEVYVNTRIRLARSQELIALARTSTGQVYEARRHVQVTLGGCGG